MKWFKDNITKNILESIDLLIQNGFNTLIEFSIKIILVILFWYIGKWVINKVVVITNQGLKRRNTDKTIVNYTRSILSISLQVLLIVGIMSFMGIQTTTFTAIIAASGLAIGMAWSGLLSNFAAGLFLMFLKPFKVGDTIAIGTIVTGEDKEIGIFSTSITTVDNILTLVGNNQILTGVIKNFSRNPLRMIDIQIKVKADINFDELSGELKERIIKIPGVIKEKGVDVTILNFSPLGITIAIRPYTSPENYVSTFSAVTQAVFEIAGSSLQTTPYGVEGVITP